MQLPLGFTSRIGLMMKINAPACCIRWLRCREQELCRGGGAADEHHGQFLSGEVLVRNLHFPQKFTDL